MKQKIFFAVVCLWFIAAKNINYSANMKAKLRLFFFFFVILEIFDEIDEECSKTKQIEFIIEFIAAMVFVS